MGKTQNYITPGMVSQTKKDKEWGFHLEGWLKKALRAFGVAFADDCCPEPNEVPVRYNKTSGELEYLNEGVYTKIPVAAVDAT